MKLNNSIGSKIKELRTQNKMTLKELSEKTGFSIGFLSQLERGLTSIAADSLEKIAKALNTELAYFFSFKNRNKKAIIRSYEKEVFQVCGSFIHYHLTNSKDQKQMLPRLIQILPGENKEDLDQYLHEGEEFVYVIEGVLTLFINNEQHELYPGDSAHYSSQKPHNWANYTSKMVQFIVVSNPNPYLLEEEGDE